MHIGLKNLPAFETWFFQGRLANPFYVVARRFLPKQSALLQVKLLKLEIACSKEYDVVA